MSRPFCVLSRTSEALDLPLHSRASASIPSWVRQGKRAPTKVSDQSVFYCAQASFAVGWICDGLSPFVSTPSRRKDKHFHGRAKMPRSKPGQAIPVTKTKQKHIGPDRKGQATSSTEESFGPSLSTHYLARKTVSFASVRPTFESLFLCPFGNRAACNDTTNRPIRLTRPTPWPFRTLHRCCPCRPDGCWMV